MSKDDDQVRYCPGCGLIGPVKDPRLACCPDCFAMSLKRWQAEKIERELERLRRLIAEKQAQAVEIERLKPPPEIVRYAKAMQQDGYRGPLTWASAIIDWVAALNTKEQQP